METRMTHVYDLSFFNWKTLIFAASPSLGSSFMPEAANIFHWGNSFCWIQSLSWVLKQPPMLSSTHGWWNSTQAYSSFIWGQQLSYRWHPPFSVSVSPGLKTYLISGRKVEPHSHCSCSHLGSAGHEHADSQCPASRVHTPDGAPSSCTLPPDSVKVRARYPWENDEQCCGGSKYISGIIFFLLHIYIASGSAVFSASLMLCSLCTFVHVGVLKAFFLEWGK